MGVIRFLPATEFDSGGYSGGHVPPGRAMFRLGERAADERAYKL